MGKRLPLLTVLLIGVALVFAALIAKELTTAPRARVPRPQPSASVAATPPAGAAATPAPAPTPPSAGAASYGVVATRNLFSPTRTEAPPPPPAAVVAPAPVLPKPNLFGVVLLDGGPVAYLEDPVSKRVARYRVGDQIAGGTVKAIENDTVTLNRPEGQVAVRLHDPTRPKPAAPPGAHPPGAPTPGTPPAGVTPPQGVFPEGRVPPVAPSRRPVPPAGVQGRVPPQPTNVQPQL